MQPRRRGGLKEWAGEEVFGDGTRALRFPDQLGRTLYGRAPAQGPLVSAFRRFHSEGTVARFEIGLTFAPLEPTAPVGLQDLVGQVLKMPVRIRGSGDGGKAVSLVAAGGGLAAHYLAATTDHGKQSRDALENWWFCSGSPALIVEYNRPSSLPRHSRFVQEVPGAGVSLSHAWFQVGAERCGVWFLQQKPGDPDAARRLRMHLVRLHAERECLKCMILHIREGRFDLSRQSGESDAIQRYLRDTLQLIQKPRHLGLDQAPMLEAAREALGVAFEGETASLSMLRRQVKERVRSYVRKTQNTATVINYYQGEAMVTNIQMGNVTVSGDFNQVTAANIQGSFNKAVNSDAGAELQGKLQELAVHVAHLAKQLSPEQAEHASKDLETLTSEAVSKTPRRKWYELSAEGLIEAAKTVAAMTKPVTEAVKAVLALLRT